MVTDNIYDVVVVGGGPSGMIAAGKSGELGKKTLLIEKNEKLGKKLYITGKGRCNITNATDINNFFKYIPKNSKFLYSAFNNLSNVDLIKLLDSLGLILKEERGGRIFPKSDKSNDVIKALNKYLEANNVDILFNSKVESLNVLDGKITSVNVSNYRQIACRSVILCTGGLSYSKTGSTGEGHKIARELGHTITELSPSLVPLIIKEDYIKDLQGLSLKNVSIRVICSDKCVFDEFGELLFTHFGLSGPIILSASFYITQYLSKDISSIIYIDLKPALSDEELDKRMVKDFEKYSRKQFKNSLDDLLPKKLIPIIISLSGIDENKEVNQITKEERQGLVKILKEFKCTVIGTRPIDEAIVTSGGISIKEVNPKTMESKLIKGLYFAGELLDLDAFTGGFNLQIAFSTGYTAGINA